jgi:hypothetical protein
VRVSVTVADPQHRDGEPERELGRWLAEQGQLRERIQLVQSGRQTGALNETILTIVAELSAPTLAAFATALVAWLRHRTSDTRIVLRRPDGARFELSARRVRGLTNADVTAMVEQLASTLDERPPPQET